MELEVPWESLCDNNLGKEDRPLSRDLSQRVSGFRQGKEVFLDHELESHGRVVGDGSSGPTGRRPANVCERYARVVRLLAVELCYPEHSILGTGLPVESFVPSAVSVRRSTVDSL